MKTKAEYEKYKKSVEGFFKREGISNLSQIQDKDGYCEPHFSGIPCECCGGMLGGDRYDCNSYNPKTKGIQEYTVCTDCVYYAEYGQLDDMTMEQINQMHIARYEEENSYFPTIWYQQRMSEVEK